MPVLTLFFVKDFNDVIIKHVLAEFKKKDELMMKERFQYFVKILEKWNQRVADRDVGPPRIRQTPVVLDLVTQGLEVRKGQDRLGRQA